MNEDPAVDPIEVLAEADFLDIGTAAARSAAMLYGVSAHALGLATYNGVAAQQQAAIARQAAVTMASAAIISLCSADSAPAMPVAEPAPPATAASSAAPAGEGAAAAKPPLTTADPAAAAPAAAAPEAPAPTTLPPELVDAVNQMQMAALDPQVVLTGGAGKAYQLVAQSAALTIQDAGQALGAVATLSGIAGAMALARFTVTGDERYSVAADAARKMLADAATAYSAICAAATSILEEFPSG